MEWKGGRYISSATEKKLENLEKAEEVAAELAEQAERAAEKAAALRQEAEELVAAEEQPPEWLRDLVVKIANYFGITPEEFRERVQVYHPTPADPVLLVDRRAVISWV